MIGDTIGDINARLRGGRLVHRVRLGYTDWTLCGHNVWRGREIGDAPVTCPKCLKIIAEWERREKEETGE